MLNNKPNRASVGGQNNPAAPSAEANAVAIPGKGNTPNSGPGDKDKKYKKDKKEYNKSPGPNPKGSGKGKGTKASKGSDGRSDSPIPKAPCYFFASGLCSKGDECLFLHEVANNKEKQERRVPTAKGSEAEVKVALQVEEKGQAVKDKRKEGTSTPLPTMVLARTRNVLSSI